MLVPEDRSMLVTIEGVDGSGKGTQVRLVSERLRHAGLSTETISFPRYTEGLFGATVGRFLNGELGDPTAVPPQFPALLFACDRLEHRGELVDLLERADVVLADRYVTSNAAYQAARLAADQREAFIDWLLRVEYDVFELPRPALQVYLRVAVATARRLVSQKQARSYTDKRYDVFESDQTLQSRVAERYEDFVARGVGGSWTAIDVSDASGAPRPAETIAHEITASVLRHVHPRQSGGTG
jgi:dTMP kinase